MKKRNVCRFATVLCSLLALLPVVNLQTDLANWVWQDVKPISMALGLMSAIFATQWIEYQKRMDAFASQPGWPSWLRRLLFSNLLFVMSLAATV